MDILTIISVLLVLAATLGYLNIRFLKLPGTIGLMLLSILFTVVVLAVGSFFPQVTNFAESFLTHIDFRKVLLDSMLSFLLFAGALHTDWSLLKSMRGPIMLFATVGVVLSTFTIGTLTYWLLPFLGLKISYLYALLFGALISPTDPIAVIGIMKKAGVPKNLEIKIVGESLFNDGIGVVVFITLLSGLTHGTDTFELGKIALLFVEEIFGGLLLGMVSGWLVYRILKTIDHYETEVLITLALVASLSVFAPYIHVSGPLAVVAAGLIIGTRAKKKAMSETTERYLDKFWELTDMLLNAILFVLIGMELIVVKFNTATIIAGPILFLLVLLARYGALAGPVMLFRKRLNLAPRTNLLLTWGGLRGGISIALALAIPVSPERDIILAVSYIVVVLSIAIQGLTLGKLVDKMLSKEIS